MKTIFDQSAREELIGRIKTINESNTNQWGKMNLPQMLRHCVVWDTWILGKEQPRYRQVFLGRIFGKIALRRLIKDEKPLDKNVPTSPSFKIKEKDGDIEALKKTWTGLIEDYANYSNPDFIHDFFGKMTREQIGIMAYKHSDHHLRQFNG